LEVGLLPDPVPQAGEVVVRVLLSDVNPGELSDVNPGDTKKRRGWTGSGMPYPRVIPTATAPVWWRRSAKV